MSRTPFYPKAKSSGKEWSCNNQCKSNCCTEMFLLLDEENEKRFKEDSELIFHKDYTDWRWVKYHKGVTVNKEGREVRLSVSDSIEWEIVDNPHLNSHMVHLKVPCSKLLANNRCAVFRARPQICKIAECPVYSGKPHLEFYAEHTRLKEALEKERKEK